MTCPKCHGMMRTYNRAGVHIEQCDSCRGIFLDYGELEHLNQLESHGSHGSHGPPGGGYGQPGWG
ncbi:MAG: zf-TFIIB domain-containing protein, partial [Micromonosporaceae bacterium]